MKSYKMLLNLGNSWSIALIKSDMEVSPSITGTINIEKAIRDFLRNRIKDPRGNHTVASSPNNKEKFIWCRARKTPINKP